MTEELPLERGLVVGLLLVSLLEVEATLKGVMAVRISQELLLLLRPF